MLLGLEDECNIQNVSLKDCAFTGVKGDKTDSTILHLLGGRYDQVSFDNVSINGNLVEAPANTK